MMITTERPIMENHKLITIKEMDVAEFDTSGIDANARIIIDRRTKNTSREIEVDLETFVKAIQPDYKNRRSLGRYKILEAALFIQKATGESADDFVSFLLKAVDNQELIAYRPDSNSTYKPDRANPYGEEVYWNDLNSWLSKHQQRVEFSFPNPNTQVTGRSNIKSLPWWQTEYDIGEMAKAAGARLLRNGEKPSVNNVAKKVATDVGHREIFKAREEGRDPREVAWGTIKNNALKGWKYMED